jgi:hypothetical protein
VGSLEELRFWSVRLAKRFLEEDVEERRRVVGESPLPLLLLLLLLELELELTGVMEDEVDVSEFYVWYERYHTGVSPDQK